MLTDNAQSVVDEILVREFQKTGENAIFAELFCRYKKRVFLACRSFLAESPAAEDATQETFLRAYRSLQNFEEGHFAAWLMRIAQNVCIDEWRKRRCEALVEDFESAEWPMPNCLDASVDSRRLVETIARELRSLPHAQRRCIELKIQGYTYEEIAALIDLPVQAVKSHLQNGRRMLWRRLEAPAGHLK